METKKHFGFLVICSKRTSKSRLFVQIEGAYLSQKVNVLRPVFHSDISILIMFPCIRLYGAGQHLCL
jgi:hypothetical protein